jgi:hypothetical protein
MVPFYSGPPGSKDYQWMDIYNALGRDRTLFVGRYLDDENCNQLIASLIWLQGYIFYNTSLNPLYRVINFNFNSNLIYRTN